MKRLLKRIWYRIVYKRVEETYLCKGCINHTKSTADCTKMFENYGGECGEKIFVKRFIQ